MSQPLDRLVADNLDIWTSATVRKSGAGRGGGKRISLYGIERLRALILDLAVRGKLVPQVSGDEPASELLARIPNDWATAKRMRRSRSINADRSSESTLIPAGWCAVAGNVIFRTRSGNSKLIKGKLHSEGGPARYPGYSASGQDVWLDDWEHEGVAIILSAVGARCGKAFLARGKWSAVANTHIIWLLESCTDPDFAMLVLNNEDFWDRAGGAQPFVKVGNTLDRDFLLPPLTEQRRIVAKVDELMALCDALERDSAGAMAAHQVLAEELLATLVNSANAADLAANWTRLETYFDTLFTTEPSIEVLQQTILELAVRGKLVEQDPGDEGAAVLLKTLLSEQPKRVGARKMRQGLVIAEQPFPVPTNWAWARLGELSELITSGSRDWAKYLSNEGAKFVTMGNLSRGSYKMRLDKMHFVNIGSDREGTRTSLQAGDLLVSITGDVGNMALIPEEFGEAYINQHTAMIRFLPSIRGRFLPEVLRSPFAQHQFNEPQRGVKNSFRLSDIQNIQIPIAPLAEQHRIVAKVDALMALCDQLNSRLADAAQTQRHLADAVTERAAA